VKQTPPSSAKAKNTWIYTSTPQYVFMELYLVKHGDKFIPNIAFAYMYCDFFAPETVLKMSQLCAS